MNPNRSQQSALSDIDSRIIVLERRLKNARAARDSYVDYLRGKYPAWRPTLPTYDKRWKKEENLVGHLATSFYHWEGSRNAIPRPPLPPTYFYNEIPKRGPFMDSDFTRTRERLTLMSQQLRTLRNGRMHMSTDDYFRTKGARIKYDNYEEEDIPSLDGVKRRLAEMSFSLMEPPSTPNATRIEEMERIETREKLINDIKSGVIPALTPGPNELTPVPRIEEFERVSEPTPSATPAQQIVTTQPRIQFAETKEISPSVVAPAPQLLSAKPIQKEISQSVAPEPAKVEPISTGPYARIMGLLNKSDSNDSDEISKPDVTPILKSKAGPALGSLSQYLQKNIQEAPPEENASTSKLFGGFTGGAGSFKKRVESDDDDFFD